MFDTLRDADWKVTICLTAAAVEWAVDVPQAALHTSRIRPDAVICCPGTFNTLNKWAAGINDSPALGLLNDGLGLGTPTLVVPMVAERLSRHPVWPDTLAFLVTAGVDVLDPVDGRLTPQPRGLRSGTGDQVADNFNPASLLKWLGKSTHSP
jgi:phosphopantothenoylcysteine synthetase/decarboxylase